MPCFKMITNISKSKIPKDFLSKLVQVLSEGVKKEPTRFGCAIEGDCQLLIENNTTLPAVIASLESIGNLGPVENRKIAKSLTELMEKELAVSPDRFFLTFYDLAAHNVARWGETRDL